MIVFYYRALCSSTVLIAANGPAAIGHLPVSRTQYCLFLLGSAIADFPTTGLPSLSCGCPITPAEDTKLTQILLDLLGSLSSETCTATIQISQPPERRGYLTGV